MGQSPCDSLEQCPSAVPPAVLGITFTEAGLLGASERKSLMPRRTSSRKGTWSLFQSFASQPYIPVPLTLHCPGKSGLMCERKASPSGLLSRIEVSASEQWHYVGRAPGLCSGHQAQLKARGMSPRRPGPGGVQQRMHSVCLTMSARYYPERILVRAPPWKGLENVSACDQ